MSKHDGFEIESKIPGHQRRYRFPNGFGASVVDNGYGRDEGLFELAVLGPDGHLTYDTPITSDVLGWLTDEQVEETLDRIKALPAVIEAAATEARS